MSDTESRAPMSAEALAEIRRRVDDYPDAVIYGPEDREALVAELDRLNEELGQARADLADRARHINAYWADNA